MSDANIHSESDELRSLVQSRTPARLFVDRAGPSYRTGTQLALRQDHALAVDAVHADLDWQSAWGEEFVQRFGLYEVQSRATSKSEYLLRPDLGREFDRPSQAKLPIESNCDRRLQIVIGDGLSALAVEKQIPRLLPDLMAAAEMHEWSLGRPFVVRYCRVGIMNEVGELLRPELVLLLIGERPGLATSDSLSAYMAYRPTPSHTDAQRNLISNIHDRGVPLADAAPRIIRLAEQLLNARTSGVQIKELAAHRVLK